MSFKSIVRELKDGIGSISRRGGESRHWPSRSKSHIVPDQVLPELELLEQSPWAELPPELLLDIIQRIEKSEVTWPARAAVIFCALVCKSWREITKEIVKTPELSGKLTFPISLKQPGPRENPIQCYIRRDRASATYLLFHGLVPSEGVNDKLLLAARKVRKATCTDFIISLSAKDFSRASNMYIGKLRSNFLGTKFTIYDSQPPCEAAIQPSTRRSNSKQVSPKLPACNYSVGTITYELNVLRTRGPRRMHCIMHSIPVSAIQEGGNAPTPSSLANPFSDLLSPLPGSKGKEPMAGTSTPSIAGTPILSAASGEPLTLRNKAPRWHEQLQCWCLNFKGRVTVASVKNFQLGAAVTEQSQITPEEQDKVILQFGKIGKDIFTMDYRYPLSAFQAFAICLSSFDTKPACE